MKSTKIDTHEIHQWYVLKSQNNFGKELGQSEVAMVMLFFVFFF